MEEKTLLIILKNSPFPKRKIHSHSVILQHLSQPSHGAWENNWWPSMMGSRHSGTPMNLLRRDCSNRERFDPFIDRYGRGLDSYFEDLAFDSRARRGVDSQIVDMSRLEPRGSIERSIVKVRKIGNRPVVVEEFTYPTLRSETMAQRKQPLPFGRAMNKLLEQLGRAEELYSGFHRDFDSDIGSIKKYATVEVLNELWVLRVLGNKDPKAIEGDDAGNDDSLRDSKELFADMRRDVARALETALDSTVKEGSKPSRKKQTRMESAKRLQRKIDTANE
jgi:hypothetical protein